MQYLYFIQQALVWIITIYWVYQLVISLCSFIKLKDKPLVDDKKHKFVAIIPAHNEEHVIGNLIESLKKQDYPHELYDIYVIADNCTDKTKEIAEELGAKVFERKEEDKTKQTKGYALQLFLNTLMSDPKMDYDAFCVFDADNIVDEHFLTAMNKHLCQGEDVVQGYRDIKNPTDSWISAGYAIFYWTMNRFYHLARYNIGLSPLLNGTGFMVKFDVVKPNGWETQTLTEDIEFSLKQIIQGRKLGWATDAIVYDEQPTSFKQSWSQRSRWTVGHMQCLKTYTGQLYKAVKEHKTLMNFDGLLYIAGTTPILVVTFGLILINCIMYVSKAMTTWLFIVNILNYLIPTLLFPIFTALFVMVLEKKPIKPMIKGLLCYPAFMGTWVIINLKCLFKRETTWEKIEHVRDIKIAEVKEEEVPEKI